MNQNRVGSFTLWAALAYLVVVVLQSFVYTRKNEEFRGAAAFGAGCAIVFIGYAVVRCWVIANAFQFNWTPELDKELPEGAWSVVTAFSDPFATNASAPAHFFFVVCKLSDDQQQGLYATLRLRPEMLDMETRNRIIADTVPTSIVIKDGIIGFKWPKMYTLTA